MASSALSTWDALLAEMIKNAPDPYEPLPLSNRKETMLGSTIPFLVSCVIG
jgi:hypothetical protein